MVNILKRLIVLSIEEDEKKFELFQLLLMWIENDSTTLEKVCQVILF